MILTKENLHMSKLIYTHAVMNSGKSISLLQANNNYISEERRTMLLSHKIDNRYGENVIASRLGGISAPCISIDENTNIYQLVLNEIESNGHLDCILADEVQFYTVDQIVQLSDIVDDFDITVMCYGLKTNFKGELFESISKLLALTTDIRELKQVCHCTAKANMVLRYDNEGRIYRDGSSIVVGAESMYRSVCRKHWKKGNLGPSIYKKLGIKDPFENTK